ncbi:hypothetical protein BC629DRAFT_1260324, partial [Irpex lacteus]
MRRYYTNFLAGIEQYYLGHSWRQDRNAEYALQAFRQAGHSRETPTQFLQHRLMFTRMLLAQLLGTPEEVREVMRAAPVSWRNVLSSDQVPSMMELQTRAMEMESQLLVSVDALRGAAMPRDLFAKYLREFGYEPRQNRYRQSHGNANANLASYEGVQEGALDPSNAVDPSGWYNEVPQESPSIVECFAVAKRRQRPPPKDGYKFKKRDDVVSSVRPPPSPCKVCGSEKHWDKECPSYHIWEKKFGGSRDRVARVVENEAE